MMTPHGEVLTPTFMPVGTHGALKAMTTEQARQTGSQVLLGNTYHLTLRPGEALVEKLGGLHAFMAWDGTLLTDSGGFQVFSLPKVEITDRGARFKNEFSGESMEITPERSIEIQNRLGADIIMAFDECTPFPATQKQASQGVRRTLSWMERCVRAHTREDDQALFAIVQGSTFQHLRASCAEALVAMDLPGYAIGGVSVGEGHELLCQVSSFTAPLLPENKPRYLMGVGLPEDLLACVGHGIDMFDCVIPTRHARGAALYTFQGKMRVSNKRFRKDRLPPDTTCPCYTCTNFSRAYLHHLFACDEVTGTTLSCIHNITFLQELMKVIRRSIVEGRFEEAKAEFFARYGSSFGPGHVHKRPHDDPA